MCYQECALYGELVLWLRDRAAELLAGDRDAVEVAVEAQQARLDSLIREWFFTPQEDLYGSAPRDIIWAEQLGEPNPVPPESVEDMFDDDCPVCTFEKERAKAAIEAGEDPGWQWYKDDGGSPLIARYDPDGWDERWADEDLEMAVEPEAETIPPAAPGYSPPETDPRGLDPEAFLEVLRRPWIDPGLQQAAQKLVERCDVPVTGRPTGMQYRRLTLTEAISMLAGIDRQGVNVDELLAQIEAWPYQNVALDWLTEPEMNVAMICQAIEQAEGPDNGEGQARLRHHRDFILSLAGAVSPGARLWLQGWLDAVGQGAFAGPDLPF
jgi:hypothetical protein